MRASIGVFREVCLLSSTHLAFCQADDTIIAEEQQDTSALIKSKSMCSMLARAYRLDQMIKISERQEYIGPQPTMLKNTLAAIVAAVWLDSRDYRAIVQVMASLG